MIIEMPPCQRRTATVAATGKRRAPKRPDAARVFCPIAHRDREPGPLDRNIADRMHDRVGRPAPGHSAAVAPAHPPSPAREFIVSLMNEVLVGFPLIRTH
jgi:hypothetical protein